MVSGLGRCFEEGVSGMREETWCGGRPACESGLAHGTHVSGMACRGSDADSQSNSSWPTCMEGGGGCEDRRACGCGLKGWGQSCCGHGTDACHTSYLPNLP